MAMEFGVSRQIDAPQERVWALLADISGWTSWNPTIISIEGRATPGTRVALVSKLAPKRTFKPKVTEVTPPERMVWVDGIPLGLFAGTRTFLVEPDGSGCLFTMTEAYTGRLVRFIARGIPDMTESFEEFATGLERAAEADSAAG